MKTLILTCTWQRDDLTRLFFQYYSKWDAQLLAVCSSVTHADMAKQYGHQSILYSNRPLGKKWNVGLNYARQLDWDNLLILGSDDFMTYNKDYLNSKADLTGIKDFYLYDTRTKQAAHFTGYKGLRENESIGAGRLLSRDLIERSDYTLWNNERNKGLDYSMMNTLNKAGYKADVRTMKEHGVKLLDVKSNSNMGKFHDYKDFIVKEDILSYFGEVLMYKIKQL